MTRTSRRKASSSVGANRRPPPPMEASSLSNKRQKSSVAGCTVVLPDDIILEVLPRLPVKSIHRFMAVCRSWFALFSSKNFCSLHMATLRTLPREPKLLILSLTSRLDSTEVYSCSLPGPGADLLFTLDRAPGNSLEVVIPSTCCGLTLLFDYVMPAYYVCNAATRAITRLPPYRHPLDRHSVGLGFDDGTREYKVVRLIDGKKAVMCDVYTAGADCWRPREVPSGLFWFAVSTVKHASLNEIPPVFANVFLHWLISPNLLSDGRPEAAIILFSVAEETFGSVPSPPFWGPEEGKRPWTRARGEHLVVMDAQVCIVRDLFDRIPPVSGALEIWGLLDYGSGDWSMNHRIDLSGHIGRVLGEPNYVRVIGSVDSCRSGKQIVIATRLHSFRHMFQEKVYTYDPRCQVLKEIRSVTETYNSTAPYLNPGRRFSLFEESLAPVHKTDGMLALSSTLVKATKETTTPN